jgi:hypothetical protein
VCIFLQPRKISVKNPKGKAKAEPKTKMSFTLRKIVPVGWVKIEDSMLIELRTNVRRYQYGKEL